MQFVPGRMEATTSKWCLSWILLEIRWCFLSPVQRWDPRVKTPEVENHSVIHSGIYPNAPRIISCPNLPGKYIKRSDQGDQTNAMCRSCKKSLGPKQLNGIKYQISPTIYITLIILSMCQCGQLRTFRLEELLYMYVLFRRIVFKLWVIVPLGYHFKLAWTCLPTCPRRILQSKLTWRVQHWTRSCSTN